jgi:hypothetical protein
MKKPFGKYEKRMNTKKTPLNTERDPPNNYI